MKSYFIFFCLVFLTIQLNVISSKANNTGKLLQLHLVLRHGDRTPNSLFPTDAYRSYTFTEGLGQLTEKGQERMYNLGKILQKRYSHFVEDIPTSHIHARSTNSRRCMESALSLLAGLFPPGTPWSKSDELPRLWRPIAVDTVDIFQDYLLNPVVSCPKASKIESSLRDNIKVKQTMETNKQFLREIEKYSEQKISSWLDLALIYDTIHSEMEYFGDTYRKPSWIDALGNDTLARMRQIAAVQVNELIRISSQYTRLRAGTFLTQLVSHLKEENNYGHTFLYLTHDIAIMNFLQAFGLFRENPSYGSGFLLELRQPTDAHSLPSVTLYYSNTTDHFNIYQMPLSQSATFRTKCSVDNCALADFESSLQAYLIEKGDIKEECALNVAF